MKKNQKIETSSDWPHKSFQECASKKYTSLKLAEINCLIPFADPVKVPKKLETYQQIFDLKLKVRDSIRAKSARELGCSESRLTRRPVPVGGLNFNFVYQRMKVELVGAESGLQKIYRGIKPRSQVNSYGVFTTSCQAAIAVLFHSLKIVKGNFSTSLSDGIYWETFGFLKKFSFTISNLNSDESIESPKSRVIYLDSSTETSFLKEDWVDLVQLKESFMLIVDTTCLSMASKKLSELIEVSQKAGVICVFVRSHMKLDCLATEYGRLGSIVFIWPVDVAAKTKKFINTLIQTFDAIAGYHATFASLSQIYPFFTDVEFHRKNELWQKRVEANNKQVSEFLDQKIDCENNPLSLKKFDHNKYFWFVTKKRIDDTKTLALCRALDRNLSFLKVPHLSIASYPWDFLSITPFKRNQTLLVDQRNRTVIRISVPDFDVDKIEEVKESLLFWVSHADRILR